MHRRGEEVHTKEEEVLLSQMSKQKDVSYLESHRNLEKRKKRDM